MGPERGLPSTDARRHTSRFCLPPPPNPRVAALARAYDASHAVIAVLPRPLAAHEERQAAYNAPILPPLSFTATPTTLSMLGKYVRLTPPAPSGSPIVAALDPQPQFAQFDPKTLFLAEGGTPVLLGRASKAVANGRLNDADNGFLKVPTGRTALGKRHAALCLRNGTLYIAMLERDGLVSPTESSPPREVSPKSEFIALRSGARVRLGVAGAASPGVTLLVDILVEIADVDVWRIPACALKQHKSARFLRQLPGEDSDEDMAMDVC